MKIKNSLKSLNKKYSDLADEGWFDDSYMFRVSIKDNKIFEDNYMEIAVKELFGEEVTSLMEI